MTKYAFYGYLYEVYKNIKYNVKRVRSGSGSDRVHGNTGAESMERKILDQEQLSNALKDLNGWRVDGNLLKKRTNFENFAASLAFVNQVGALAEAADHHPDITFGWGYAELELTTHDRGGITDVDIALARKINGIN